MEVLKLTLICERCKIRNVVTEIGIFDYKDLSWPLDCSIFKSPNSKLLPDPFPAGLVDQWEWARCRVCGSRPFLNLIPQGNGLVMIVTGERIEEGTEGNVLTLEHGYIPIPGYPNQSLQLLISESSGQPAVFPIKGEIVEQLTQDPPPQDQEQTTENGPALSSACDDDSQAE